MKKNYKNFGAATIFKATNRLMIAMTAATMNKEQLQDLKKRLNHMVLICDKTLETYDEKIKELNDRN